MLRLAQQSPTFLYPHLLFLLAQNTPLSMLFAYESQEPDKPVFNVSVSSEILVARQSRAVSLAFTSAPPGADKVNNDVVTWASSPSAELLELSGACWNPHGASMTPSRASLGASSRLTLLPGLPLNRAAPESAGMD